MCQQKLVLQLLLLVCGESEKQSILTLCKVLPIYLTNNSICKECFDGFIIIEYGYGIIEQMESCSYYVNVLKVKEYCFGIKLKQNVLKRCVKIFHLFRIINVSHIELIMNLNYKCYTTKEEFILSKEIMKQFIEQVFLFIYICDIAPNSLSNYRLQQSFKFCFIETDKIMCISEIKGRKNRPNHVKVMLLKLVANQQTNQTVYSMKINVNKDNIIILQFILVIDFVPNLQMIQIIQWRMLNYTFSI
ncbi:unnamed protein product [Paramecium primaurelia]|uniref:Transmembrane protein n=1 Tax=Paramecium primaurelia TaxID=5886 RepID=A0A8S1P5P4_PARPR|nr:unnamed protein product [Paramecium primaurelia]